jgi:hypothetical protein
LLGSEDPAVRWRVRTRVLGESAQARAVRALSAEVRGTPRAQAILRASDGLRPYAKWRGSHWALLALAAMGYPHGDSDLLPLRDAVLDLWLAPRYLQDRDVRRVTSGVSDASVPRVAGRSRRCASQQGGALLAVVTLGIDDGRAATLAQRLCDWQWPDGGWNCDRRPATAMSSVHETLLPMRALSAFANETGDEPARETARAAAEVFLTRRVAWRRTAPEPITPDVMKLHYPVYWHFDLLAGLVGLAELGLLGDARCTEALDYLESRRLPDGGWTADARYWRLSAQGSNTEAVSWGPTSPKASNEWVTCDALTVLSAGGRL